MKKLLNVILIIIYVSILTLVSMYFFKKWNIGNKELSQPSTDVGIVDYNSFFTGIITTGGIDTGTVAIEQPQSEIEKFLSLKNREIVYFPVQPLEFYGDFASRTQILVAHAKDNMKTIIIPSKIKGGYLYIKLRKNLPVGRSAVIYIKAGGWWCGGGIRQMGYTYNNNEYLYKLTNVPLIASDCGDNWLPKVSGQTISIGGYVGTFDGNGIEQIVLARY